MSTPRKRITAAEAKEQAKEEAKLVARALGQSMAVALRAERKRNRWWLLALWAGVVLGWIL